MKWIKSILAIIIGMILISVIAELIEYLIVTVIMGVKSNPENPASYFDARNRPPVLVAKHFYNFIAGFTAGYVLSKIVGYKVQLHAYILICVQVIAIAFALTQPEIKKWLPISLWISITLTTILGIFVGMCLYLEKIKETKPQKE